MKRIEQGEQWVRRLFKAYEDRANADAEYVLVNVGSATVETYGIKPNGRTLSECEAAVLEDITLCFLTDRREGAAAGDKFTPPKTIAFDGQPLFAMRMGQWNEVRSGARKSREVGVHAAVLNGFYRARGINVHVLIKGKDLDIELEPAQVAMTAFSYFMENLRSVNVELDASESKAIQRIMGDGSHALQVALQVAAALCPPPEKGNDPHWLRLAEHLLKATDVSGQPLLEPALASAIAKVAGARLDAMRNTQANG